jgi:hypothetical protein
MGMGRIVNRVIDTDIADPAVAHDFTARIPKIGYLMGLGFSFHYGRINFEISPYSVRIADNMLPDSSSCYGLCKHSYYILK